MGQLVEAGLSVIQALLFQRVCSEHHISLEISVWTLQQNGAHGVLRILISSKAHIHTDVPNHSLNACDIFLTTAIVGSLVR